MSMPPSWAWTRRVRQNFRAWRGLRRSATARLCRFRQQPAQSRSTTPTCAYPWRGMDRSLILGDGYTIISIWRYAHQQRHLATRGSPLRGETGGFQRPCRIQSDRERGRRVRSKRHVRKNTLAAKLWFHARMWMSGPAGTWAISWSTMPTAIGITEEGDAFIREHRTYAPITNDAGSEIVAGSGIRGGNAHREP